MTTEVWFRKADTYPTTCIDLLVDRLSFRAKDLKYRAVDVDRFLVRTMPPQVDYRALVIGEEETLELRRDFTREVPYAVYPTWDYERDEMSLLEELCEIELTEDERRIVIVNIPKANTAIGRRFYTLLADMQRAYPEAIIHPHGLTSYRIAFGFGFTSVDLDPQASARKTAVTLPNGRNSNVHSLQEQRQWVSVLGYSIPDLKEDATRVAFNIHSAHWAAAHWTENFAFKSAGPHAVDPDAIDAAPAKTTDVQTGAAVAKIGDKVLCNQCSLAPSCKYYRTGEVCSLPTSESSQLAKSFGTRNPDTIIDGLQRLMGINTERLEAGLQREEFLGGGEAGAVDPTVTTLINSLFDHGVKVAKLLDPKRFSESPKIVHNEGPGAGSTIQLGGTPQSAVAAVYREFENRGLAREDVTPTMVEALLREMSGTTDVIDVEAIEGPDDG